MLTTICLAALRTCAPPVFLGSFARKKGRCAPPPPTIPPPVAPAMNMTVIYLTLAVWQSASHYSRFVKYFIYRLRWSNGRILAWNARSPSLNPGWESLSYLLPNDDIVVSLRLILAQVSYLFLAIGRGGGGGAAPHFACQEAFEDGST